MEKIKVDSEIHISNLPFFLSLLVAVGLKVVV